MKETDREMQSQEREIETGDNREGETIQTERDKGRDTKPAAEPRKGQTTSVNDRETTPQKDRERDRDKETETERQRDR